MNFGTAPGLSGFFGSALTIGPASSAGKLILIFIES